MKNKQQIIQNQAIGPLVFADKETFLKILREESSILVVYAEPNRFIRSYSYITSVRGITFTLRSKEKIELPTHIQRLQVKQIQIPFAPVPDWAQLVLAIFFGILFVGVTTMIVLTYFGVLK
jgi:hypothetical protein